jgi:hypothetical protein
MTVTLYIGIGFPTAPDLINVSLYIYIIRLLHHQGNSIGATNLATTMVWTVGASSEATVRIPGLPDSCKVYRMANVISRLYRTVLPPVRYIESHLYWCCSRARPGGLAHTL